MHISVALLQYAKLLHVLLSPGVQAEDGRKGSPIAQHAKSPIRGVCINQLSTSQTYLLLAFALLPVQQVTALLRKQSISLPWLPSPWLGLAFPPRCRQPFNTALEKGRVDEVAAFKSNDVIVPGSCHPFMNIQTCTVAMTWLTVSTCYR